LIKIDMEKFIAAISARRKFRMVSIISVVICDVNVADEQKQT